LFPFASLFVAVVDGASAAFSKALTQSTEMALEYLIVARQQQFMRPVRNGPD